MASKTDNGKGSDLWQE